MKSIDYQEILAQVCAGLLGAAVGFLAPPCSSKAQTLAGMAQAIDGDTIVLGGKTRIRLWGIDAPELEQYCVDYQAGKVAKAYLEHVMANRRIMCSIKTVDRYQRSVGICTNIDGIDIGRAIVVAGHAWAYTKYSMDYVEDENKARASKIGLWRYNCVSAERWRRDHGTGQLPIPKR